MHAGVAICTIALLITCGRLCQILVAHSYHTDYSFARSRNRGDIYEADPMEHLTHGMPWHKFATETRRPLLAASVNTSQRRPVTSRYKTRSSTRDRHAGMILRGSRKVSRHWRRQTARRSQHKTRSTSEDLPDGVMLSRRKSRKTSSRGFVHGVTHPVDDMRTYVAEPQDVQRTIFPVRGVRTCVCQDKYFLGTCFMLEDLNEGQHDCVYFATAAHNLICSVCKKEDGVFVNVGTHWKAGQLAPDKTLLDPSAASVRVRGPEHPAVGLKPTKYGWTRVPEQYKTAADEYERFAHDYGLIAIRRDAIRSGALQAVLGQSPRKQLRFDVQLQSFYPRAFICGYPAYVYDNKVTLPPGISKADGEWQYLFYTGESYDKGHAAYMVAGSMYWVNEANSIKGQQLPLSVSREMRYDRERPTSAMYPMPQDQFDESDEGAAQTNTALCRANLFRHYIDTSGGQSGSPVYVRSTGAAVNGEREYKAIAIHVGLWSFQDSHGIDGPVDCNVAVRLTGDVRSAMLGWIQEWDHA